MAAATSGKKTVTTKTTEVRVYPTAGEQTNVCVAIKALSSNTGLVYVGNDGNGAVSSLTGYELGAREQIVMENVDDLYNLWLDSAVDGEGVSWLILGRH
jgi:hypothetical protein